MILSLEKKCHKKGVNFVLTIRRIDENSKACEDNMFVQKKKQREKLEMLYRTYRKIMYYVALEIIQDSYLAEDIVSEAFFRVARHLDKINEEQSQKTKAFLCIVTKHIAIDFYRKQKNYSSTPLEEAEYVLGEEERFYEGEGEALKVLSKIPSDYAQVLLLKYAQGYSNKEIGEFLEISEENVRQRIHRGKKKLQEILGKESGGE